MLFHQQFVPQNNIDYHKTSVNNFLCYFGVKFSIEKGKFPIIRAYESIFMRLFCLDF